MSAVPERCRAHRPIGLALLLAAQLPCQAAEAPPPAEAPRIVPVDPTEPELRRRPDHKPPPILAPEPLPDANRRSGLRAVAPAPIPPAERVICEATPTPGCLPPDAHAPQVYAAQAPLPSPDRWRLLDELALVNERWYDSYHQNTLKGDKPWSVTPAGEFRFLSLAAMNNTVVELRRLPSLRDGTSLTQRFWSQNLIASVDFQQGNTTFKPPDWSLRATPVINSSYLTVPGAATRTRGTDLDSFVGLQELYADRFLRTVSPRYDFDAVRVGIQPLSSDFRGFLFQDSQLAARLYGTRDGNRWQYNVVAIKRLVEDPASALNDVRVAPRADEIVLFNLYRQDWPVPGFIVQGLVAHNRNRERDPLAAGLLPRSYEVTYLGANGDGHFGRINLTASATLLAGTQSSGIVSPGARTVLAGFAAAEASIDVNWLRFRFSALYQSGDGDPDDDTASGYDALEENPIFAGADTAFWSRQSLAFARDTRLSLRNGLLNGLRPGGSDQSNFENPGLILAGIGTDADLTPTVRLSSNINHLRFDRTAVLSRLASRGPVGGAIGNDIGWDLSAAAIWRPYNNQNVVLRMPGAWLIPGAGLRALYADSAGFSLLGNFIFTF